MNVVKDTALLLLEKGLDALSMRQTTIANNIANVETPNYKAADVAFETSLRKALDRNSSLELKQTDDQHLNANGISVKTLSDLEPRIFQRTDTSMRLDGNNVDVETEMVKLAETATRFQALSTLASRKLALLRMVAREGR